MYGKTHSIESARSLVSSDSGSHHLLILHKMSSDRLIGANLDIDSRIAHLSLPAWIRSLVFILCHSRENVSWSARSSGIKSPERSSFGYVSRYWIGWNDRKIRSYICQKKILSIRIDSQATIHARGHQLHAFLQRPSQTLWSKHQDRDSHKSAITSPRVSLLNPNDIYAFPSLHASLQSTQETTTNHVSVVDDLIDLNFWLLMKAVQNLTMNIPTNN